jgi:hypothetical protein
LLAHLLMREKVTPLDCCFAYADSVAESAFLVEILRYDLLHQFVRLLPMLLRQLCELCFEFGSEMDLHESRVRKNRIRDNETSLS